MRGFSFREIEQLLANSSESAREADFSLRSQALEQLAGGAIGNGKLYMPITNIYDQLRRDEEERQFAYDDATGKTLLKGQTLEGNLTIGVGHNLTAKGLSQKSRDFILEQDDVPDALMSLEANFPWVMELDEIRKGALLNMNFNMGPRGLAQFKTFLAKMQAKDFPGAAEAMLDSLWAKQVGARATRLSLQIESGFWQ